MPPVPTPGTPASDALTSDALSSDALTPAGRPVSRRALLGGLGAAAVVTTGRVPAALASSLSPGSTPATPITAPPPTAGSTPNGVETRVAPAWTGPADPETPTPAGRLGETDLESFGLIGISAVGLSSTPGAQLRVLTATGWEPWTTLHANHAPDVSEPVWVGSATGYQIQGTPAGRPIEVHLVRDRSSLPLREPSQLLAEGRRTNAVTDPTPPIILRDAWGARPAVTVEYWPTIRIGIIHHSVTSNSYSPSDVPSILRSIQAYHMDVNGWWDIAYQFLIDDFGNMWEGREGGIDESFFGAHSLGFNGNTFGVCNIGDFSQAQPTNAMLSSIAELTAWKLKRYDIDAAGMTTVEVTNDDNEWYKVGDIASLPAIVGHSDTRPDECPGHLLEAWLPWIRNEAHNRQGRYKVKPPPAAASEGRLARNTDGRLEVFGIGADAALHNIWQQSSSPTGWSGLNTLGGSFPAQALSAIRNADGRLEVFMAGNDGLTYHTWQAPGSPDGWSGYWSLSSRPGSAPAVARNADGRLEVFGVDTTGQLWHAWQMAPNSGWSDPSPLAGGLAGPPGVGASADGRLVVWTISSTGNIAGIGQSSAGGAWGSLVTLAGALTGRPAVGRNADGRMEVFALGTDHRLYHSWQNGYVMSDITSMGNATFGQPPAVGTNADGRMEVFGVGTDGHLWHTFQVAPNSSWSDVSVLDAHSFTGPPSVTANADGRLEVFVAGPADTLWHGWQAAPNSGWSDFIPLTSGLA